MGLTMEQRVGGVCNEVAWFTFRQRLKVAWALLTARAS